MRPEIENINIPSDISDSKISNIILVDDSFSNQYGKKSETTNRNLLAQTPKQNDIVVNDCTLLNMVSSRANKNEFNESMIYLWAISNYYSERGNYGGIR